MLLCQIPYCDVATLGVPAVLSHTLFHLISTNHIAVAICVVASVQNALGMQRVMQLQTNVAVVHIPIVIDIVVVIVQDAFGVEYSCCRRMVGTCVYNQYYHAHQKGNHTQPIQNNDYIVLGDFVVVITAVCFWFWCSYRHSYRVFFSRCRTTRSQGKHGVFRSGLANWTPLFQFAAFKGKHCFFGLSTTQHNEVLQQAAQKTNLV